MATVIKRHTAVRIDESLYELLAKAAADEGRSINQQIIFYIKAGLKAEKAE